LIVFELLAPISITPGRGDEPIEQGLTPSELATLPGVIVSWQELFGCKFDGQVLLVILVPSGHLGREMNKFSVGYFPELVIIIWRGLPLSTAGPKGPLVNPDTLNANSLVLVFSIVVVESNALALHTDKLEEIAMNIGKEYLLIVTVYPYCSFN